MYIEACDFATRQKASICIKNLAKKQYLYIFEENEIENMP